MSRITSYRIVLPKPWVRIPVQTGTEDRVHEITEDAVKRLPKEMPPDQVGPWRREVERRLVKDIRRAREYGGIDFYLPTDTWHGFLVGTSFVVSEITPPGLLPDNPDEAIAALLAELATSQEGSEPVSIGDVVWVRSERVVQPDEKSLAEGMDVPTRRVDYLTAVPDEPKRWVLVGFSGAGDGDPDSEISHLVVELFDAMMSTWRWIHEGEDSFDLESINS